MAGRFETRDIIRRYSARDMRYYLARGIGHLKPDVLRQLIHDPSLPVAQFRVVVNDLLQEHCSRFAAHSLKWRYPVANPDLLTRMIHYNLAWEGFHVDEPWHACVGQRVRFFYDSEFQDRVVEMEDQF